jgi:hypothetical protein
VRLDLDHVVARADDADVRVPAPDAAAAAQARAPELAVDEHEPFRVELAFDRAGRRRSRESASGRIVGVSGRAGKLRPSRKGV